MRDFNASSFLSLYSPFRSSEISAHSATLKKSLFRGVDRRYPNLEAAATLFMQSLSGLNRFSWLLRRALIALTLSLCGAPQLLALVPDRLISQYGHRSWRAQDGYFPARPIAIAQTADGYIWVGTAAGLVRFDGVRFATPEVSGTSVLRTAEVHSLLGTRDGSLWIGTNHGVLRLRDGKIQTYPQVRDFVFAIVEDRDGTIWLARSGRNSEEFAKPLCHVTNEGARCFGKQEGLFSGGAESLTISRDGAFWLGTDVSLVRWKDGTNHEWDLPDLRDNAGGDGIPGLAADRDGSVWIGKVPARVGSALDRMQNGVITPFKLPGLHIGNVVSVYVDSHDAVWLTTPDKGLIRISNGKVDQFQSADGLSSDFTYRVFEDREGSLWVTTRKGLDCFTNTKIVGFSKNEGLRLENANSVLATRSGQVWIGTSTSLQVLDPARSNRIPPPTLPGGASAIYEDRNGDVWFGQGGELVVQSHGQVRRIPTKSGKSLGLVYDITQDSVGDIFAEVVGDETGLYRIKDFQIVEVLTREKIPEARSITGTGKGLWIGLRNGDLAHYSDHKLTKYQFSHDKEGTTYKIEALSDDSVMAAASYGLIGLRNGRKWTLDMTKGLPCQTIYSVITDLSGNVWASASCGLMEIVAADMKAWWEHPEGRIVVRLFDTADGMQPGRAPFDSSSRSPDGRIWFANGALLQMVDPFHLEPNRLLAPVHIESLSADHKTLNPQDEMRLPARLRELQIDYTALSMVAPQKVRFRYRLEGHDVGWTDAEGRRQAFYNDLAPGRYTFRVVASNNDGLWNEVGSTLHFAILPAWHQTVWFRSFTLLIVALSIWLLYRFRIERATSDVRMRTMGQAEERIRLAREIHDTLLQGIQGLLLTFHVAAQRLPSDNDSRLLLDHALATADRVLAEGRDRVMNLRSERVGHEELKAALEALAIDLAFAAPVKLSVAKKGINKTLRDSISDEVFSIAREALTNAYRHSRASEIVLELNYGVSAFSMLCHDNGQGFVEDNLPTAETYRHWGMRGMRERAGQIGARFACTTSPGQGTKISVVIPARRAYVRRRFPLLPFMVP